MTELSPVTAGVDSGGTVAGTIDTLETLESEDSVCEEGPKDDKYNDIIVAGEQSEEEYTIEAYDDEFESFAAGDDDGAGEESIAESIPESIPEDSSADALVQSPISTSQDHVEPPVTTVSPPEKYR